MTSTKVLINAFFGDGRAARNCRLSAICHHRWMGENPRPAGFTARCGLTDRHRFAVESSGGFGWSSAGRCCGAVLSLGGEPGVELVGEGVESGGTVAGVRRSVHLGERPRLELSELSSERWA